MPCCSKQAQKSHQNISFRFADQLSIGDEVLVQRNYLLTPGKVINVSNIDMPGNYSQQRNKEL